MSKLSIDRIGQLAAMPRAPMVRRFGQNAALRPDQSMGHAFEPINPLIPEETALATLAFAKPIGKLETLKDAVCHGTTTDSKPTGARATVSTATRRPPMAHAGGCMGSSPDQLLARANLRS